MKIRSRVENHLITALSQSMTVKLMEKLAQRILPGYDLHQRSGFPETIPIPQLDAARQITRDIKSEGLPIKFIELLIDVDRNGLMGREVSIRSLPRIINEIEALGFAFSEEYGIFIECRQGVETRGWGVLREGVIYDFSFLRYDIVDSSGLVRRYPEKKIAQAYSDLKQIVAKIVVRREGRVWSWQGDGGLAAFYFENKNVQATLCGMEILLEMFMYNLLDCPFDKPVQIRLAAHTGPCPFLDRVEEIQSDTLRRLQIIESQFTESDSLTISPGTYSDLGTKPARFFRPFDISNHNVLYRYRLSWE